MPPLSRRETRLPPSDQSPTGVEGAYRQPTTLPLVPFGHVLRFPITADSDAMCSGALLALLLVVWVLLSAA